MLNTPYLKNALRLVLPGVALVTLGFAQMMGPGPPATGAGMSGSRGGMGSGMQGGISGMGAGMGSMDSGPVVGADGTAYVLRQTVVTTGGQQTTRNELVAIHPSSGKVNWALEIAGTMISQPVLAKDGTILLTTSEPNVFATSTTTTKPALVIVAQAATSARVQARITIDSEMLSLPVMTPDGQTIYVVAAEMPAMAAGRQTVTSGTTFLYAFVPGNGTLKFKVQLQ